MGSSSEVINPQRVGPGLKDRRLMNRELSPEPAKGNNFARLAPLLPY